MTFRPLRRVEGRAYRPPPPPPVERLIVIPHPKGCENKHRDPDELTARARGAGILKGHQTLKKLWVYRCPGCRGFHLTRKPNSNPAITADSTYELKTK